MGIEETRRLKNLSEIISRKEKEEIEYKIKRKCIICNGEGINKIEKSNNSGFIDIKCNVCNGTGEL